MKSKKVTNGELHKVISNKHVQVIDCDFHSLFIYDLDSFQKNETEKQV